MSPARARKSSSFFIFLLSSQARALSRSKAILVRCQHAAVRFLIARTRVALSAPGIIVK